jgi:hypothetical protein
MEGELMLQTVVGCFERIEQQFKYFQIRSSVTVVSVVREANQPFSPKRALTRVTGSM